MKQLRNFILFAAAAVLSAVACTPEEVPDSLTLTDGEIAAPASGISKQLTFTTNVAWTVASSASWVTVTPDSGTAGDITATVTVAENDTWGDRTATVVFTAGTLSATYTVSQTYTRVFEVTGNQTAELDEKAQTIAFKVNSNLTYDVKVSDGCDWITPAATKAAPVETPFTYDVAANKGVSARTATITITPSEGTASVITVNQKAAEGAMAITKVAYISNRQGTYDFDSYAVRTHGQWVIDAATATGSIRLVVTAAKPADPLKVVPSNIYTTDAADTYKDSTCTVGAKGHEFYTTMYEGTTEKEVSDAQITISSANGEYTIVAKLADAAGKINTFNYTGAFPEIANESDGVYFGTMDYLGDYNTHFATGTEAYSLCFYPSAAVGNTDPAVYMFGTYVYVEKGTAQGLPTGTFKITADYESLDSPYYNGIAIINAGSAMDTYAYADYNDGDYKYFDPADGTVTISKNDNGTCKVVFDVKGKVYHYDSNWNEVVDKAEYTWSKTYDNVVVPELKDNHSQIAEDVDTEFKTISVTNQYVAFGLGNNYETYSGVAGTTFFFGWNGYINDEWKIQMVINTSKAYTFNTNYGGRYSDAPVPAGTYTYQQYATKATDCIANTATLAYKCITNNYTGTAFYISGGSMTLDDAKVSFDLYGTTADGSKTLHFTGGFDTTIMYARDTHTSASYLKRGYWNSSFLYPQTTEPYNPIYGYEW